MENKENSKEIHSRGQAEDALPVYEVSYLILPLVPVEQLQSKSTDLKKMLESLGGAIISDEDPVLIDLSYKMTKVIGTVHHKVDSGYFGWIKFELPIGLIEKVKKSLDGNDEIFRYLVIKTVKENTLLGGKMKLQKEDKLKKEEVPVSEVELPVKDIIVEDIDKSIDDLVIV